VTAKVKMALLTTPDVGGARIDVDTDDGQVTLHGQVTNEDERADAERAASEIAGVRAIRNLLQVVPEHREKGVRIVDAALKARVSAVLKAHPDLAGISPKSVHAGVVLLDGKAERFSDHLEALEVVANVGGVRRVESEIHSPDRLADREIWFSDEPIPTHQDSDAHRSASRSDEHGR
jgi:osmotically-inducible protein OsmY